MPHRNLYIFPEKCSKLHQHHEQGREVYFSHLKVRPIRQLPVATAACGTPVNKATTILTLGLISICICVFFPPYITPCIVVTKRENMHRAQNHTPHPWIMLLLLLTYFTLKAFAVGDLLFIHFGYEVIFLLLCQCKRTSLSRICYDFYL